jgi:hypothetical protein
VLPGQRKPIPYENPQRRRLNVLAAVTPYGPARSLIWARVPRTLTTADFLYFVRHGLPSGPGLRVVVLDNGSIHRNREVQAARGSLREQGIVLYYLPPYSPELNAIEPLFGVVKQYELPERTYPTITGLREAVDGAFTRVEERVITKHHNQPRLAA